MIQRALDDGMNVTNVYVDTVGIAENYERNLTRLFSAHNINFVVCPKVIERTPSQQVLIAKQKQLVMVLSVPNHFTTTYKFVLATPDTNTTL